MKYILCLILSMLVLSSRGDNLRIHGDVQVMPVSSDVAELEVKLSWSNSWRNAYNHDAVYLFGKFSKKNAPQWNHIYFDTTTVSHTVSDGYALTITNGGRGALVYRTSATQGTASVTVRFKWKLSGNTSNPLTRTDLDNQNIQTSLHGIEMAYVPTAPFYAGDGQSPGSFSRSDFGILPAACDIIGTSTNYTYSGSGGETGAAFMRPADRYNQAAYNASSRHDWNATTMPATWQVDFKTPKTILYFGVSGTRRQDYPPAPASDWYFEGSTNGSTWIPLWQGGPDNWGQSGTSYPVQQAIRVTTPGAYRYYRVRVTDNQCPNLWNNVRINNVAMTETDLSVLSSTAGVLQDGLHQSLHSAYPVGVNGFYAMKYELTQEQYVTFLNQLPRSGQYTRTLGGLLDGLKEGDYIFGDAHRLPSFRNGIILNEQRLDTDAPYAFACNLNPANAPGNIDDGQTLACNYLSVLDMLAYADWSGLRPLSELEYEKMCRGYYPSRPTGGGFAWESLAIVPSSGVQSGGRANETSQNPSANVNGGGGTIGGPCRVGMFVRSGNREQSGNSFWGFSDLSGNVSEIYLNSGLYGRQFDSRVHGNGDLKTNGMHTVVSASWPGETEAYGLRGGDYSSPVSGLSVSNRENAEGYFGALSERHPTVGFRLGYTSSPRRIETCLTLENGEKSGNTEVSDTVCDASSYVIRGDNPFPVDACRFLWYRSIDNGETWELVEGENDCDLKLVRLTEGIEENVIRKYLFKRVYYTSDVMAGSGTVAIFVGSGYQFNRLTDTLQPCMQTNSIEVKTILPATFEWHNLNNNKILVSENKVNSSSYTPDIKYFTEEGALTSKEYTLNVMIRVAKRCQINQEVKVIVIPHTKNPFTSSVEKVAYANNDKYQIACLWTGKDAMSWKIITGEREGITLDSQTGVLSGLSEKLCYEMTVELTCANYPDKVYRKKILELERNLSYTGNYQTLELAPGTYKMECWGANGGKGSGGSNPEGYGGYTKGEIVFPSEQVLYFYVGEYGNGVLTGTSFNGGGGAPSASGHNGGRGGGASDIRTEGGAWNNQAGLRARIMVAGGGGGAMPNCGGMDVTAGHGGGLVGATSWNRSGSYANNTSYGGSQTAGGSFKLGSSPNNNGVNGSWGQGAYAGTCAGGAGSGYYGGGTLYTSGGGGGSSFISGYSGCDAVDAAGKHTGTPLHFSGLQFENMLMLDGEQNEGNRVANGHGRVLITVIRY